MKFTDVRHHCSKWLPVKVDNWWNLTGHHLTRNVLETFFLRHYFSDKNTFLMICNKIGVSLQNVMLPLYTLLKIGESILIPHKNLKNIKIPGDISNPFKIYLVVAGLCGHPVQCTY